MRQQHIFVAIARALPIALPVVVTMLVSTAVVPSWAQVEDTTPPALISLSLMPTSVDTSSGPAMVKVNFSASDAVSGVTYANMWVYSPSGNQHQLAQLGWEVPGHNVTGSFEVNFAQYAEGGTWTITYLSLVDAAGNSRAYRSSDLVAEEFPTQISVVGQADTTAPVLTSLSMVPASVDTSGGPAMAKVNFSASDNLSGVTNANMWAYSPSGNQHQLAQLGWEIPSGHVAGVFDLNIPQYAENGIWTITDLSLVDAVGNIRTYRSSDLVAEGFPTQISVAGQADTTAPVLTSLSLVPTSVDTSGSPAMAKVNLSASDNLSGVTYAYIWVYGPSGNQHVLAQVGWDVPSRNVIGSFEVNFPQYAENGTWTITYLYLADKAGNSRAYDASELAARGLPTEISVGHLDRIAPTTTMVTAPLPNENGWNNSDVDVAVTAIDNTDGSGVERIILALTGAQAGSSVISGNTGQVRISASGITTLSYYAVDKAGNHEITKTSTVRIDKTPPTVAGSVSPVGNENGWNNSNVTISFAGIDSLSGIASCTAPIILVNEGSGQTVFGTCTDKAGNVNRPTTVKINIDKTPPTIWGMPASTCTIWPPNHKLVHVGTVTVTDSISGVAVGSLRVIGTSSDPSSGEISIRGGPTEFDILLRADKDEIYTLVATARDIAGNFALTRTTCSVPHSQGK